MYAGYSEVRRRKLVLRHSVDHFQPDFRDLSARYQNEEMYANENWIYITFTELF